MERKPHLGLLLLVSLVVFCSGFVIDQAVRWSDHSLGLKIGLICALPMALVWCFVVLPWSVVVQHVCAARGWKRYRTLGVLAPAVVTLAILIGGLVVDPPTAAGRFRRSVGMELPENARNVRAHFHGGFLVDRLDHYDFETTPEEVGRLIAGLGLAEDRRYEEWARSGLRPDGPAHWPDVLRWEGARHYKGEDGDNLYVLTTDGTRTRVRLMAEGG